MHVCIYVYSVLVVVAIAIAALVKCLLLTGCRPFSLSHFAGAQTHTKRLHRKVCFHLLLFFSYSFRELHMHTHIHLYAQSLGLRLMSRLAGRLSERRLAGCLLSPLFDLLYGSSPPFIAAQSPPTLMVS